MSSRVLEAACVAAKSPISSYFIRRLVSEIWSALFVWMWAFLLILLLLLLLLWMYIFMRANVWICFFPFSVACDFFCFRHFHSNRQCFPFPCTLFQSTNSPFPHPAALSAKTTRFIFSDFCSFCFQEWLFLSYCSLSRSFSLFYSKSNYYYYYCKVYLEKSFVHNTITILL